MSSVVDREKVPLAEQTRVFVPLHADSWALALASGYLGGSLKADPAEDLQSLGSGAIIGFQDKIPRWALEEGESGKRVVLVLEEVTPASTFEEILFLEGPIRVSSVKEARFASKKDLNGFMASMAPFPDVAENLIPSVHADFPVIEKERPISVSSSCRLVSREEREELDFLAGWAAGLVGLLEEGEMDDAIIKHLGSRPENITEMADSILLALNGSSNSIDRMAWSLTVNALAKRYRAKGFDRQDVLDEVGQSLRELGDEAIRWIKGARAVINAERDLPDFSDAEHIGRRAALALLLVHDPRSLRDIEDSLSIGTRTKGLVTLGTYAFTGLAKLGKELKSPLQRLQGTLAIAETLNGGEQAEIDIVQTYFGTDLSRHSKIQVDGKVVCERTCEPPPHMLMLKARAQEAGFSVNVDDANGDLSISKKAGKGPAISILASPLSTTEQPVVDLVLPLDKLGGRPTVAHLKSYLELAATSATAIGLRTVNGFEEVIALVSIPLATLDRDEMTFHVERLLSIHEAKPAKKRRTKKKIE